MRIDGKQIASEIISSLKERVDKLKEKGITPHFLIVMLIDDAQTESYIKQKLLRTEEIGAVAIVKRLPSTTTQEELLRIIEDANKDKKINGIIVQRPMPKQIDEDVIAGAVMPEKDIDGFNPSSRFGVPVAIAVIEILKRIGIENFENKKISVIGKGITAGKPTIEHFKKLGVEPNVIDSKTTEEQKKEILGNSDIVISAVGKKVINPEYLKQGSVVIGIGMHVNEMGKLKGDYEEDEIKDIVSYYTPTPGGIGPVNVTMLMQNLVEASELTK